MFTQSSVILWQLISDFSLRFCVTRGYRVLAEEDFGELVAAGSEVRRAAVGQLPADLFAEAGERGVPIFARRADPEVQLFDLLHVAQLVEAEHAGVHRADFCKGRFSAGEVLAEAVLVAELGQQRLLSHLFDVGQKVLRHGVSSDGRGDDRLAQRAPPA